MMALSGGFLIALGLALSLTPLGIRMAWATGYLDHPEARKLHTSATALLGGVVVFACAALALLAVARGLPADATGEFSGVWQGAVIVLAVGMWDDRFGMNPLIKLLGQVFACLMLFNGHFVPEAGLPGPVSVALATFLLVALMNAVNFLDNMNGMVGGIAGIAFLTYAWTSFGRGSTHLAAAQLALAGACLGFLRYNFPRARLFLGDAGSLFLGYSLGASGLLAFEGAAPGWGRAGALLVLAYPAFDMIFVVTNRIREGRRVWEGGKDHSNHRLASVLKCQKTTVLMIWLVGAALSASGLVVLKLNRPGAALLSWGLWIILFLLAGLRLSSVPVERTAPSPSPVAVSPAPKT